MRGEKLVKRKIKREVEEIERGIKERMRIGNIEERREWGNERDYVEGMWRIIKEEKKEDYVIEKGEKNKVSELIEKELKEVEKKIVWNGDGVEEIGIERKKGNWMIEIEKRYLRKKEVDLIMGDD